MLLPNTKPNFGHGPGLIWRSRPATEAVTRREAAHVNPGKVSAKEEAAAIERWASTVNDVPALPGPYMQIDSFGCERFRSSIMYSHRTGSEKPCLKA